LRIRRASVVDAGDLPVVAGDGRPDPVPGLAQNPQDVGQVLLTLTVVRPHLPERVREELPVEGEDPGVDLTDRALRLARVLVLDDRGHRAAGAVPHDAAVAGGVGDLGGEHGDGVAVGGVGGGELPQRLTAEQRGVAADHDDGAVDAAAQLLQAHAYGVTGAVLLRLHGRPYAGVDLGEVRGDLLAGVTHHDDQVLGLQRARGREHMAHQGAAAQFVQDLGCGRLHTGALTRCENDDGCRAIGAHGDALRLHGVGWTSAGYRGVSGGT
jgi:hypothetical protein